MNSKNLPKNTSRLDGCTVTGALTVTAFIKDAATIVHGPAGCTHQSSSVFHSTMLYNECFDIPEIFTSGLNENGVIFGGEGMLRDAIEEALTDDYKCIFVVGTCISDTIGDDIDAVCESYDEIPVIPVQTSGFLGGSFERGFISALKSASKLIEPDKINPADAGQSSSFERPENNRPVVNIIGEKNLEYEAESNFSEVKRLINLLGADINVRFVRNIYVDDIKKFADASLNVIREDPTGEIKSHFDNLTNIPSISSYPYGISGTTEFLRLAGKYLKISPARAIEEETENQKEMFSQFEDLKGEKISFDSFGFQKTENSLLGEIAYYAGIVTNPEGTVIPVPFYTPVGTTGVKRTLMQWRRFINA
ncbi:nitrogenase molybdenum-iron protein alpha/beta subunit [Methanomicrobium sp. W14]|uniref:nitrogenase component 1 n=1 Tax=Methanomicrobium sp. W14 TaxID=2817839 RepID=UPI001AE9ABE9|nr:nitrogenase component 1 [Methanomicrobium sp. W14]MBP2134570.1 nitrogenase molybdenum-iron protein alpha/beta subunit [Methanomicrobium sp. W14]